MQPMTPKQRAQAALELRIPDQVPTFELEFQLAPEFFGRPLVEDELSDGNIGSLGALAREDAIRACAQYYAYVHEQLDYCIIPAYGPGTGRFFATGRINDDLALFLKALRERIGDKRMLGFHGDGTFAIPDGSHMCEFIYRIADDPAAVHEEARAHVRAAIKRNHQLRDAGVECFLLCSDYCYNTGPFLSPKMFAEFITPYLGQVVDDIRGMGLYAIKHTDGNIMPVLDQLVSCRPHALHSLDPMAGVDIRTVKRLVGDKVCLCGNVHCAAMQTGTDEDVTASAEYCLTHAKPGGGYIFCTSNVPFRGMPPERYRMILDIWKRMRDY